MVMIGFAARGRRLLRAIYHLLDQDLAPESVPLLRTMSEYVIVSRWLALDPAENLPAWGRDSARATLLVDDRALEHGGFRLMPVEPASSTRRPRRTWRRRRPQASRRSRRWRAR